jgi:hypothetical protein
MTNKKQEENRQIILSACARVELMVDRRKELFCHDGVEDTYKDFCEANEVFAMRTSRASFEVFSKACADLSIAVRKLHYTLRHESGEDYEGIRDQLSATLRDLACFTGEPVDLFEFQVVPSGQPELHVVH